ncbi:MULTISPECIES: hypothetical protein [Streptomyces]|uniref:hypothetical protein n=1 Tax=Streptomyces TaxID=1883 RepID=UPI0018D67512|nr:MULTISPECIES: hypothetical protein [Streptomyces]
MRLFLPDEEAGVSGLGVQGIGGHHDVAQVERREQGGEARDLVRLVRHRLPEGGLGAFDAYESAVLPLLSEYGGRLERRLRTLNDQVEAHLITFPASEDLAAYRADPRPSAAAPLLESSGAAVELLAVRDA